MSDKLLDHRRVRLDGKGGRQQPRSCGPESSIESKKSFSIA
jgi:hypothetical protein